MIKYEPLHQHKLGDNFPIALQLQQTTAFMAMSDYSLQCFDLQTQKTLVHIPNLHQKRIQSLVVEDNIAITSSNDKTIKITDLRNSQLINQFKTEDELYSLAKSKHILASGGEGRIFFYDLNIMKLRSKFDASQNEEISCLQFKNGTQLLSCSTDGLLVEYDLSQINEEESLSMMIRFNQPLNSCGYWGNLCYSVSTTNEIAIIDEQKEKKLCQFNATKLVDDQWEYFIGVDSSNKFNYFISDGSLIQVKDQQQQIQFYLKQKDNDTVRHIRKLGDNYILFNESGLIEYLQPKAFVNTIQDELNFLC